MRIRLGIACILISFATGLWADSPVPGKRLTLIRDVDLPGGDILIPIYFKDPDGTQLEFAAWARPLTEGDVTYPV